MHYRIPPFRRLVMALAFLLCSVSLLPGAAVCSTGANVQSAVESQPSGTVDFRGITVHTDDLDDGVTGVTGTVSIDASPSHVWAAITDYNHHKYFVPKLLDSGLISDNGHEQVMFERGKTGILLFRKTVYIKLSLRGDYPRRLDFRQLEGDFKVYEGQWLIEKSPDGKGSLLTFRAKIKPDFFAPSTFVRTVQRHDLPMVLDAMKKRAESTFCTVRFAGISDQKHSPVQRALKPIVD